MQLMFGIHRSIDRIYSQVYSQVSSSIRTRYTDKFICLYCLLIVLLPPKEWRYTVYLHIIQTKRNTSLIFFIGILNALDTQGQREIWILDVKVASEVDVDKRDRLRMIVIETEVGRSNRHATLLQIL